MMAFGLVGLLGVSCTTAYDGYGNARQVVDPAAAAVGVAAVGVIAYSIGRDDGRDDHRPRQRVYRQAPPRGFYR